MYKFGKSSKAQLSTCQHELQEVMSLAITKSKYDFGISEGIRTEQRQTELVAEGRSRTHHSRHLANKYGMSEACDVIVYVDGAVTWDIKYYRKVAKSVFEAAIELGIQIEWGGLWENFCDGPHYQLGSK
jgi:peptidoglycan L-alanyl-D-glutamate endopeptidase CwlK